MQRKERFFGAVFIDVLGTPLTMLIGIIVIPLYFKFISIEEFGYWTTVLELMSLLTLINSGIGFYIIQTVSGESKKGFENTQETMSSLFIVQILLLFLVTIACVVIYFILPSFAKIESTNALAPVVYILMLVNLIITTISSYHNYILQGQYKVIHTNIISVIKKILIQILPVILLMLGFGILSFPVSYLVINSIVVIVFTSFIYQYFKSHTSISKINKKDVKDIFIFIYRSFLGGASYYVLNFTDCIIIANFISNSHVAIYVLSMKLGNFLRFIPARIVTICYPVIAQLYNEKNYLKLQDLTLKVFRFNIRFGIFTFFIIYILNEIFVINWVGYEKFGGVTISLLSAFICLRESIFALFYNVIFATKDVKWFNYILLFEGILNLILSLIFVNIWGITGVAFATVLSTSLISVCYGIYKTSLITKTPIIKYLPSLFFVLIKSVPSVLLVWLAKVLLTAIGFSWILFLFSLLAAGFINILFFEGLSIFSYRHLNTKEILNKIIENS